MSLQSRLHLSLIESESTSGPNSTYLASLARCREIAGTRGIDAVLQEFEADAILMPGVGTTSASGESCSFSMYFKELRQQLSYGRISYCNRYDLHVTPQPHLTPLKFHSVFIRRTQLWTTYQENQMAPSILLQGCQSDFLSSAQRFQNLSSLGSRMRMNKRQ